MVASSTQETEAPGELWAGGGLSRKGAAAAETSPLPEAGSPGTLGLC